MKIELKPTRRTALIGLAAGLAVARRAGAGGLPEVAVTKDPSCGCCEKWVTHMREAGFTVTVTEGPVTPLKVRLGVPRDLASCHTAQVGGYVIEGHVPAGPAWRSRAGSPIPTRSSCSGPEGGARSPAIAEASWSDGADRTRNP